jgi:hypothetical protein
MADDGSAGATRHELDDDTLDYLRVTVGRDFDLSEPQARRLRGTTVAALKQDARAMRRELGLAVEDDDERDGVQRDERGRFTGAGNAMNRIIRQASGRR